MSAAAVLISPAQVAMHLRVRRLLVLIELFLLVIGQDGEDSFLGV